MVWSSWISDAVIVRTQNMEKQTKQQLPTSLWQLFFWYQRHDPFDTSIA